MAVPEYSGRGRRPSVPVPSFPAVSVGPIAKDDSFPWMDVALGTGAKGAVIAKDKSVRVAEAR
ncbi:MAG: hypothetical protein LBU69_00805, partial [Deltaproteobacteria bacterium]|nr:hypothetical protein [Deltaproteobacteria bacterium]